MNATLGVLGGVVMVFGLLSLIFVSLVFGLLVMAFGIGLWAVGPIDKKQRNNVIEAKDKQIEALKAQLDEKTEITVLKARLAELEDKNS